MPEQPETPALVLFGPTGSGKTELLEKLFAHPNGGAEIVSADSMQVYRGMDIGTAKPSPALRKVLPHRLIDIRNPDEQFTVGDFVHLADLCCTEIARQGMLPVVSGGAGFYLKHFVQGLPEAPPADPGIRAELKEELRLRGTKALMAELADCDPESARRIHSNDVYRLLRALEVYRFSQRPLSSFSPVNRVSADRPKYRFLIIGLEREREELYHRIDERCVQMFRAGLLEEVQRLFEAGYTPEDPGLRGIGYKEFFENLGEKPSPRYRLLSDISVVETLVRRNSRRYAKRQITYFASIPGALWISASKEPVQQIAQAVQSLRSSGTDILHTLDNTVRVST
ncbi:MAG: tRNA (adenosine(37)-N6)-dimethylallyltransferase MiaA [Treponema sp.]|jgi:tRNA dimethylallyltransferase|nr:tRNA (adenosine(37)-N6)-dimethylallyltransferase MiaA [Treponema sp.]